MAQHKGASLLLRILSPPPNTESVPYNGTERIIRIKLITSVCIHLGCPLIFSSTPFHPSIHPSQGTLSPTNELIIINGDKYLWVLACHRVSLNYTLVAQSHLPHKWNIIIIVLPHRVILLRQMMERGPRQNEFRNVSCERMYVWLVWLIPEWESHKQEPRQIK